MNTKPILFSTPMVQSIQQLRKTKTRRLKGLECVNDEPDFYTWCNYVNQLDIPHKAIPYDDKYYYEFTGKHNNSTSIITTCPYGKKGDVLYVRENWQLIGWDFEEGEAIIRFTDGKSETFALDENNAEKGYEWLLRQVEELESKGITKQDENDEERFVFTDKKQPLKPSIFLPKFCSRIFLRITDVKPERLRDISEGDAIAEGIDDLTNGLKLSFRDYLTQRHPLTPIASFKSLWIKINKQESWDKNPWVWVIEFKKIDKPENFK